MFTRADVIGLQVGEDSVVIGKSSHPVQLHGLAGHLHHHVLDAGLYHLRKVLLHQEGLRGGVDGRDVPVADDGLDGADKAGGFPRLLQDAPDHVGGGGLALGTGNADGGQFFRRVAIPGCCQLRQGQTGVLHPEDRHILGDSYLPFHYQGRRALFQDLRDIVVSVCDCAGHTEEDAAGNRFPGVVNHFADLLLQAPLHQGIVHAKNKVDKFHSTIPSLYRKQLHVGVTDPLPLQIPWWRDRSSE